MNRIQLTRITPITDQILLIAFKDNELGKHDVKFMLHQIDGLHPRSDKAGFQDFLHKNKHILSAWERKIGCAAPEPDEDSVEVTMTMPADELAEVEATCADMNITVQQLALAVVRFCVDPDSGEALQEWYAHMKKERPSCPKCNQELKRMIALGAGKNNFGNLYTCNNCGNSWVVADGTDSSMQNLQRYFLG